MDKETDKLRVTKGAENRCDNTDSHSQAKAFNGPVPNQKRINAVIK